MQVHGLWAAAAACTVAAPPTPTPTQPPPAQPRPCCSFAPCDCDRRAWGNRNFLTNDKLLLAAVGVNQAQIRSRARSRRSRDRSRARSSSTLHTTSPPQRHSCCVAVIYHVDGAAAVPHPDQCHTRRPSRIASRIPATPTPTPTRQAWEQRHVLVVVPQSSVAVEHRLHEPPCCCQEVCRWSVTLAKIGRYWALHPLRGQSERGTKAQAQVRKRALECVRESECRSVCELREEPGYATSTKEAPTHRTCMKGPNTTLTYVDPQYYPYLCGSTVPPLPMWIHSTALTYVDPQYHPYLCGSTVLPLPMWIHSTTLTYVDPQYYPYLCGSTVPPPYQRALTCMNGPSTLVL
jgi:hypothetical protein